MESPSEGNQGGLLLQAMANMYICKKAFGYFAKK
jgi:hypothetical protein